MPATVDFDRHKYLMPCSAWPMDPVEYAKEHMEIDGQEAFFSGTVLLPDGPISISVPIPAELAKQIAVLSVQYDLVDRGQRKVRRENAQAVEIDRLRAELAEANRLRQEADNRNITARQAERVRDKQWNGMSATQYGPQPTHQAPKPPERTKEVAEKFFGIRRLPEPKK